MRCIECGKEIPANETCCSFCGAVQHQQTKPHPSSLAPTTTHCVKCGKLLSRSTTNCYYCGAVQPTSGNPATPSGYKYIPPQTSLSSSSKKDLPMKWYYFLIYFYLFVNSIGYLFDFIKSITKVFGPGINRLWLADVIFGLFYLGMAVYCLITRHALANYKKNGPRLLLTMYIIVVIASIVNILVFSDRLADAAIAAGGASSSIFGTLLTSIVTELIMYSCNAKYFEKRAHLFTD